MNAIVPVGAPRGFRLVEKGGGKYKRRLWSLDLSRRDVDNHGANEIVGEAMTKMVSLRPSFD